MFVDFSSNPTWVGISFCCGWDVVFFSINLTGINVIHKKYSIFFLLILQELLSQAARILGSVDFLGNPMGLLNDVSEGVTGLIKYGNVSGLIRNVTHGVSNSAAKVKIVILKFSITISKR